VSQKITNKLPSQPITGVFSTRTHVLGGSPLIGEWRWILKKTLWFTSSEDCLKRETAYPRTAGWVNCGLSSCKASPTSVGAQISNIDKACFTSPLRFQFTHVKNFGRACTRSNTTHWVSQASPVDSSQDLRNLLFCQHWDNIESAKLDPVLQWWGFSLVSSQRSH